MGDVKLVAMMGLYLGRAVAPALLVALIAGALVGAVMIARGGAAARKQAIPFGPFLALGGVVGLWAGDGMVDWYLEEFFPRPAELKDPGQRPICECSVRTPPAHECSPPRRRKALSVSRSRPAASPRPRSARTGRSRSPGIGVAPLEPGVFREGEVVDADALGEALKELFAKQKLSRNVRLGVANQRIAVRTLHLPLIENDYELETAIRFQAQDQIPMPLEQAVLDWQVSGHRTGENGERPIEVTSSRRAAT